MDFFYAIFHPSFMPHGHCYFWRPEMVWLQVVANIIIGASYTSISLLLFALTRRMRGLPFRAAYVAFGAFIVLCGATHFMDVVTVWEGVYWIDGGIRALTALASAVTAIWLFPLFPRIVEFRALIIAERELSRAQLIKSERSVRDLIDHLPDLAWSARADGHIEFYNQRWYEYTGTTPEQMAGWGWRRVHDPEFVDSVEARWRESLAAGTPMEMEFPIRAADGSFRWFLTRVLPQRDPHGNIVRWVGTNTDIDEQRQARAELRRSVEVRDAFLRLASHELRTPLQALVLQLETLSNAIARGDAAPGLQKRVGNASSQVDRMTTLVASMLDSSRVALGVAEVTRVEADLMSVVHATVDRSREVASQLGASIVVSGPPAVLGLFDPVAVDQIIGSLLHNALKYGAGKPIHVDVETDPATVAVHVVDQGIGIAAADHERIFQRYERAASPNYGGLGLGLYLAREIARAHGGDVVVESTLAKGSRFREESR